MAQEIARQGGALYDKFVGFVAEMEKIGKSLDRGQFFLQRCHGQTQDGNGNLTTRAERLRELGSKIGRNCFEILN